MLYKHNSGKISAVKLKVKIIMAGLTADKKREKTTIKSSPGRIIL